MDTSQLRALGGRLWQRMSGTFRRLESRLFAPRNRGNRLGQTSLTEVFSSADSAWNTTLSRGPAYHSLNTEVSAFSDAVLGVCGRGYGLSCWRRLLSCRACYRSDFRFYDARLHLVLGGVLASVLPRLGAREREGFPFAPSGDHDQPTTSHSLWGLRSAHQSKSGSCLQRASFWLADHCIVWSTPVPVFALPCSVGV